MNRFFLYLIGFFAAGVLLSGCAASSPYYAQPPGVDEPPSADRLYSVFLIGDTGNARPDAANPNLELLQQKLLEAGENSAVVILGDILYPHGLPRENSRRREQIEAKLTTQLDLLKPYEGRIFFVPGNHDWSSSGQSGLEAIRRMEQFVEAYLDSTDVFVPSEGFPGPVDIKLMDKDDDPRLTRDIHFIAIDTQWWLHRHEKAFGETGDYMLTDAGDFLNELTDVMRKRQNDHVVVAGHHPMFSNGRHGGKFTAKRHLLPPVFGTAYVLYRKMFGFPQDIPHYRYQSLKNELLEAFDPAESLVYASGHEHLLQHTIREGRRRNQHYVVSGSGTVLDYAAKGNNAEFVSADHGFAAVHYYSDRSSWLEFWKDSGELLYRRQLLAPDDNPFVSTDTLQSAPAGLADSSVTVAANSDYDEVGRLHRTLLGSHNRSLWSIPVEAPVFDVATVKGGLDVIKMGGTGQTTALRLQDNDGRTYVLRSVDKEAGRVWDPALKQTLAKDLAQDQFSIINPYGALMMPGLAQAVEVYHTKPELYVVPDDPRLGHFAERMHGQLVIFEERPDEDMSHAPHLSGSDEVLSTRAMFRKVDGDIDHRVDQRMMLRNRLLDMLVSDWDRHEDQWRWAAFEPHDFQGKIYQPIPRDRDMAFMRMDGLIPEIGKYTFWLNYQDFQESYGNLKGLSANSLSLTRRFTNQLNREDWEVIADSMKMALTDEIIEQSVRLMPDSVVQSEGENISKVLKIRRDQLPEVALQYYNLLAPVVDIVGSHKREKFIIESISDDTLQVRVYKVKSDGEVTGKYFDRTFLSSETQEIRLYGLGGDDLFEVKEGVAGQIKIRLIGGSGNDLFKGSASGLDTNIFAYDTKTGSRFEHAKKIKRRISDETDINRYDYKKGFQYNRTSPLVYVGSNRDDGLFLGGGAHISRYGYRKYPAAEHRIRANIAFKTQAFNIRYDGSFADVLGSWNGKVRADALLPNNIRNFYGLGNETDQEESRNFYRARLQQYRLGSSLSRTLGTGVTFSAGPHFQLTKVRQDEAGFVGQPQAGIAENTFEDQWFGGFQAALNMQSVDNEINPRQGFRWQNNAALNAGIRNTTATYGAFSSSLVLYMSPVINPQLTLATRLGVEHNEGPFPFYEARTLGGKQTLRGLLSNRYAGRTSFHHNIELRSKLFSFQRYLLGGDVGMFGFFDHGRVWTDGERSKQWHYGTGGGAWMSVFNMAVIRGSVGFAEGGYNILVGAGFFF